MLFLLALLYIILVGSSDALPIQQSSRLSRSYYSDAFASQSSQQSTVGISSYRASFIPISQLHTSGSYQYSNSLSYGGGQSPSLAPVSAPSMVYEAQVDKANESRKVVMTTLTIILVFGIVGAVFAYKNATDKTFKYRISKALSSCYCCVSHNDKDDAQETSGDAAAVVSSSLSPSSSGEKDCEKGGSDGSKDQWTGLSNTGKISFCDFQKSLPLSLRNGLSYFDKIGTEIKQRHRWFRVTYASNHITTYMKLFSLITTMLIVMFFEGLIFHYFYPNNEDPHCKSSKSESHCIDVKSIYYHNVGNCKWNASTSTCDTTPPSNRLEIVVLVAIFAVFIAYPLIEFCDYLIFSVLSRVSKESKNRNIMNCINYVCSNGNNTSSTTTTIATSSSNITIHRSAFDFEIYESDTEFLKSLKQYRDLLGDSDDRKQFDAVWKIQTQEVEHMLGFSDSPESYLSKSSQWKALRQVVVKLRAKEEAEIKAIMSDGSFEDDEILGKRLLLQFQLDLLDLNPDGSRLPASEVIKNMIFRDSMQHLGDERNSRGGAHDDSGAFGKGIEEGWLSSVKRPDWINSRLNLNSNDSNANNIRKSHAWFFILLLDFFICFYLYWFGARGLAGSQSAWLKSFLAWSVADILFVSPLIIVVVNILLPNVLIGSQLASLHNVIKSTLTDYKLTRKDNFNSSSYFMLSHRLSKRFPHLKESKLIQSFTSTKPPLFVFQPVGSTPTQCWLSLDFFRKVWFSTLEWYLKLPILLTDFFIVEALNIFAAYFLLGIVALCRVISDAVSPFLIFILAVPLLLICSCIYYFIKEGGLFDVSIINTEVDIHESDTVGVDSQSLSIDQWFEKIHGGADERTPTGAGISASAEGGGMLFYNVAPAGMEEAGGKYNSFDSSSDSDSERALSRIKLNLKNNNNNNNDNNNSGLLFDDSFGPDSSDSDENHDIEVRNPGKVRDPALVDDLEGVTVQVKSLSRKVKKQVSTATGSEIDNAVEESIVVGNDDNDDNDNNDNNDDNYDNDETTPLDSKKKRTKEEKRLRREKKERKEKKRLEREVREATVSNESSSSAPIKAYTPAAGIEDYVEEAHNEDTTSGPSVVDVIDTTTIPTSVTAADNTSVEIASDDFNTPKKDNMMKKDEDKDKKVIETLTGDTEACEPVVTSPADDRNDNSVVLFATDSVAGEGSNCNNVTIESVSAAVVESITSDHSFAAEKERPASVDDVAVSASEALEETSSPKSKKEKKKEKRKAAKEATNSTDTSVSSPIAESVGDDNKVISSAVADEISSPSTSTVESNTVIINDSSNSNGNNAAKESSAESAASPMESPSSPIASAESGNSNISSNSNSNNNVDAEGVDNQEDDDNDESADVSANADASVTPGSSKKKKKKKKKGRT